MAPNNNPSGKNQYSGETKTLDELRQELRTALYRYERVGPDKLSIAAEIEILYTIHQSLLRLQRSLKILEQVREKEGP
jgi:hypothetical protein